MPPTLQRQRCQCKYRQCCNKRDPQTGEIGVVLNSRNYHIHQRDEQEHEQEHEREHELKKALEAQQDVIAAHESSIEVALSNLLIDHHPTAAEVSRRNSENKYRIDRTKAMIAFYSAVLEDIAGQKAMIDNISTYSHGYHGLNKVYESLRCFKDARDFICRTEADPLRKITRGPLRNEPSVEAQRQGCILKLRQLEDQIVVVESFWLAWLEHHKRKMENAQKLVVKTYETAHHFTPIMEHSSQIIHLVVFMVVVCHMILGSSRRAAWWILSMTEYIVQTASHYASNGSIPTLIQDILSKFPLDVRTATKHLHLEAKGTVYAACPKCHKLYKGNNVNGIPIYREKCNYRRYRNGSKCKALLVREKQLRAQVVKLPIKPFVALEFKDWMANLMSRMDVEKEMDAAWDRMSPSPDGSVNNIFQASYVREFKGHDGRHFSQTGDDPDPESKPGRYLFSLGFDFFNPYRNLAAGKKVSIGIIALICLNLPIELRYKPENIFLAGIIPGPQEPSLDAINPYFVPIVDEFVELWQGVRLTKTALYEIGRLILCAIIAIVADLPAARKVGGFVACTHDIFCSLCWCSNTVETLDDFDYHSWKRRTGEECRTHAQAYRAANTPGAAQSSVDKTGLRSSEFLRLPYYDPTINLIVDPMHNLFLGLIKEHFQGIIGCQSVKRSGGNVDDFDDDYVDDNVQNTQRPMTAATDQRTVPASSLPHAAPTSAPSPPQAAPTLATAQTASHPRPSIRPTQSNPLPEHKNAKRAVRKLTDWLVDSNVMISEENVDILATRFSGPDTTIAALVYIGKAIGCFAPTMTPAGKDTEKPEAKRIAKKDLARALVEWQRKRLAEAPQITAPRPELFERQGTILTPDELRRLRQDIKAVVKPSWVTAIPTTIAPPGPKLKSDQWRAAGSLYLPISLVRQWTRPGDATVTPAHKELLDLTMHLFLAICIVTSRVTSKRLAEEYLTHMVKYRQELQRIFPKYKCHPNHHMAMHIHEFIDAFGPVHGWWTFPFERMIGTLQRIPINYKPGIYRAFPASIIKLMDTGEYEETIARTWHRRANLKALLSKDTCPSIISSCVDIFTKLTGHLERNSMAMVEQEHEHDEDPRPKPKTNDHDTEQDDDDFATNDAYDQRKEKPLSPAIVKAFRDSGIYLPRAIRSNRYRERGVPYAARNVHEGNSCVLIPVDGADIPFSIQTFVQLPSVQKGSKVWIVARRHCLPDIRNDPFTAYPYLRAKMWSPECDDSLEAFPFSSISGQFAKCDVPWVEYVGEEKRKMRVVICVSLSRVQAIL